MRPARCIAQPGCSIRVWIIELGIPLVSISLKDAASVGQMAMDVFFLPIRREGIDRAGWRGACPRPLVADIGPDPAFLDALSQAPVAQRFVQNADRGVVGMEQITGHD